MQTACYLEQREQNIARLLCLKDVKPRKNKLRPESVYHCISPLNITMLLTTLFDMSEKR